MEMELHCVGLSTKMYFLKNKKHIRVHLSTEMINFAQNTLEDFC